MDVHWVFGRSKSKLIGRPVPTPTSNVENPAELWSRPSFDFPALLISAVGVRPNSQPIMINGS
jgi:hypothetical protein